MTATSQWEMCVFSGDQLSVWHLASSFGGNMYRQLTLVFRGQAFSLRRNDHVSEAGFFWLGSDYPNHSLYDEIRGTKKRFLGASIIAVTAICGPGREACLNPSTGQMFSAESLWEFHWVRCMIKVSFTGDCGDINNNDTRSLSQGKGSN